MEITKFWNSIDDTWSGPKRSLLVPPSKFPAMEGHEAYCRHCGEDILYKVSPYTSWVMYDEGIRSLASGVIRYKVLCEHCGKLNDPDDRVYFDALDIKDGSPIDDFYLSAMQVFRKVDYDEYLAEYEKEGHVTFILRR